MGSRIAGQAHISSFCSGGDCVEVEKVGEDFAIRESHNGRATRELLFSRSGYEAFIFGVKAGEFT